MPIAQNGKRIIHTERSTHSFKLLVLLAGLSQKLSQKPSKNGSVSLQAQRILLAAARLNQRIVAMVSP